MVSAAPKTKPRLLAHPLYADANPGQTTFWPGYGPNCRMPQEGYLKQRNKLVQPVALANMTPGALDLIEDFLLPAPHSMWMWMENEEVKCTVAAYERGVCGVLWANININRILWDAQYTRATRARNPEDAQHERDAHAELTRVLEKRYLPPGQICNVLSGGSIAPCSPTEDDGDDDDVVPSVPNKRRRLVYEINCRINGYDRLWCQIGTRDPGRIYNL